MTILQIPLMLEHLDPLDVESFEVQLRNATTPLEVKSAIHSLRVALSHNNAHSVSQLELNRIIHLCQAAFEHQYWSKEGINNQRYHFLD